jgi:NodT family efflux transporter outer membrane factor (OMF) lipoprotein
VRRSLAILLLATLSACGGPALRAPEVPLVEGYGATPALLQERPGATQRVIPGRDIPAQWWTLFQSPALDRLVREALDDSPTIARAAAKLRQAREVLEGRSGATRPRVDAGLTANRVDVNPESLGAPQLPVDMPLNLYLASVRVSYNLDLFGATRHELEALRAAADSSRYELEAARQALAANVVTTAIRAASLHEQIAHAEGALALQSRQVAIAEGMEKAGGFAHAEVAARREELARARAALPDLVREREQLHHRLAIYTGRAPGAPGIPEIRLAELRLPGELPLSLPSALVRQRPDILASEALLQEAAARVGVATANLYPQVTLTATAGSLASSGSGLFSSGTAFYLLGASLAQPLFNGGELQSKRRLAVAAYDQAAAVYRETVLRAFGNVADTLRALEADAVRLDERTAGVREARSQEGIAAARYAAGGVSELALLEARRRTHNGLAEQARALADQHADSAALLQAVGGGWWNEAHAQASPPPAAAIK